MQHTVEDTLNRVFFANRLDVNMIICKNSCLLYYYTVLTEYSIHILNIFWFNAFYE